MPPENFGITIRPSNGGRKRGIFAHNEIFFDEPNAPDWEIIGKGLHLAAYNYMRGEGLDLPVGFWFKRRF